MIIILRSLIITLVTLLVAGGAALGGFAGGFLVGLGLAGAIGAVTTVILQAVLRRRVVDATSQLAGALGPRGDEILRRLNQR